MKKNEYWVTVTLPFLPKVTNFDRVRDSAVSNRLAKPASKSEHPFGWNFVHKETSGQTHTQPGRQTHRQTAVKNNPLRCRWGVKISYLCFWRIHLLKSLLHSLWHNFEFLCERIMHVYMRAMPAKMSIFLSLRDMHIHYSETRDLGLKTCQRIKHPGRCFDRFDSNFVSFYWSSWIAIVIFFCSLLFVS